MHNASCLVSLVAAVAAAACIVGDQDEAGVDEAGVDEEVGTTEQALAASNGVNLNGVNLNGVNLNGVNLNGVNLNGVNLNGTAVTGVSVGANGLTLVKSSGTVSGAGAVGARLTGQLSNGGTLQLKIQAASLLPGNVWGYRVEATSNGTTWANICPVDTLAIAIAGRWDYRSNVAGAGGWISDATSLTFACRGFAIAKCVEWGYAPWKTVAGVLLRDHHQACVRLVRGDYCGNGATWTQDGTPINLYDALGVQTDTMVWTIDAEWTAAGANCLNKARTFAKADDACIKALKDKTSCGAFGTGVLLIDEYKSATTMSSGASSSATSFSANH